LARDRLRAFQYAEEGMTLDLDPTLAGRAIPKAFGLEAATREKMANPLC
jgi:hypothetical protein